MFSAFVQWHSEASPALIAAALLGMILAAALAGWIARWQKESLSPTDPDLAKSQHGYLVAAMLGNLALLLAFTFSVALDRFESRRKLAIEEANAIGTSYLRAQLLEEPHRTAISSILIAYTNNRLELGLQSRARPSTLAANDALLHRLWRAVVAATPSMREGGTIVPITTSFNQLIDLDLERKMARRTRVPTDVFAGLYIYLFVVAVMLGWVLEGRSARVAAGILFGLIVLTITLIVDLDEPTSGRIRESQLPVMMLRDSLAAAPPASFN